MPKPPESTDQFESLVHVVEALRGPDGCPWDKEQTHASLVQYAVEEAFEYAEAVEQNDVKAMTEELGDLLLQVVLNAEIARQEDKFTLKEVIDSITRKMVRRHPHVFANLKVENAAEVLERWDDIKASEKPKNKSPFGSIPKALPALQRASKIGTKTKKYNFDWSSPQEVFVKVNEEKAELEEAMESNDKMAIEHEIGDLFFSLAQLARHLEMDPEQALRKANMRFEGRFLKMMEMANARSLDFESLSQPELEGLYREAKLMVD